MVLTYGIPPEFRGGVHLFILNPSYAIGSVPSLSGHAIAYRWRCRESTDTGPVNLKVVPVTGAALVGHHGPINVHLSFPHPLDYWYEVVIAC